VLISFVGVLVSLDGALVRAGVVDLVVSNGLGVHFLSNQHLCPLHFGGVHVRQLLHVNVRRHLLLLVVVVVRELLLRLLVQVNGRLVNALLLVRLDGDVRVHRVECEAGGLGAAAGGSRLLLGVRAVHGLERIGDGDRLT